MAIDQIHSNNNDESIPLLVLYADIHDAQFGPMFSKLISLANEGSIDFMLRYKPIFGVPLSVTGYGVELAVKNTEYKVADDRVIKESEEDELRLDGKEEFDVLFSEITPAIKVLTKEQIESISHLM